MAKPNLLIFMTDQQRGDTVPPFHRARTPNLDRLSHEGVTFSQTFCPAPHCCPARATFFTGLYPSEHGVWNNVDVGNALSRGPYPGTRLWSDDLRDTGYSLYFSGKWHVSAVETPVDRGWMMRVPSPAPSLQPEELASGRPHTREWDPYRRLAQQPEPQTRGEAQILRPGYSTYTHYGECDCPFRDEEVVDDAIALIHKRSPSDGPWVQFVGTLGPHDPYFVPAAYLDLYSPDEVQLPASYSDRLDDKPALYRRTRDRFDQLTEPEQREALRHYLAFCTYQDVLFGRVLAALEETGWLESTAVLYLSDHGDYAGDHGLWCKGLPCFRGSYHVPAILRWPEGIARPGSNVDAFVSLADFAPTFLDMAGVDPERPLSGLSLLPFLRGQCPEQWRDAIFTQTNGNELYGIQRSIMTREWKYVYNGFDYDELYDLRRDPDETRNLSANPQYREVVRQMCRRLWRFAYEHKDVPINQYITVALAPFGPAEAFRE